MYKGERMKLLKFVLICGLGLIFQDTASARQKRTEFRLDYKVMVRIKELRAVEQEIGSALFETDPKTGAILYYIGDDEYAGLAIPNVWYSYRSDESSPNKKYLYYQGSIYDAWLPVNVLKYNRALGKLRTAYARVQQRVR